MWVGFPTCRKMESEKIENGIGNAQAAESFSGMMAGVRVKELIGDVSENGGATR